MIGLKRVEYNWFSTDECGEEFQFAEVGKNEVTAILYNRCQAEGDRHYAEIHRGAEIELVFNLSRVVFK